MRAHQDKLSFRGLKLGTFDSLSLTGRDTKNYLNSEASNFYVKLIGNMDNNIKQIMNSLCCNCGAQEQFRNILKLLMERNYYKQEIDILTKTINHKNQKTKLIDCGANTDQSYYPIQKSSKFDFNIFGKFENEILDRSGLDQSFLKNNCMEIRMSEESNLLDDSQDSDHKNKQLILSEMRQNHINEARKESNKLYSHQQIGFGERIILGQKRCNANNLSIIFKEKKINLNKFQNFIEKLNCVKELQKEESFKRKRMML